MAVRSKLLTYSLAVSAALVAVALSPAEAPDQKPERHTLELPGRVVPFEHVDLSPGLAGVVGKINVDIGDAVRKGEILAEILAPELEQELAQQQAVVVQARTGVEQAQQAVRVAEAAVRTAAAQGEERQLAARAASAACERAEAEFQRLEKAAQPDPKVIAEAAARLEASKAVREEARAKVQSALAVVREAEARVEKARADVKWAEAHVDVVKLGVRRLGVRLQWARVVAPFEGIVVRRRANQGQLVGPAAGDRADVLLSVARIDVVRVVVSVPEADAPRVGKGSPAIVQGLAGREYQGQVARTAFAIDPQEKTMRAEIDLTNPKSELRPGMTVTARISVDAKKGEQPK